VTHPLAKLSPYKRLVNAWQFCQKCDLHKTRQQVVFARGQIPCDVLMVGEAPGSSEDVVGIPFVGPAGKLLDDIIATAIQAAGTQPRIAFFNLVGCIPKDEETNRKKGEPTKTEIEACSPRLGRFIEICKPIAIVCAGDLPTRHSISQNWGRYTTNIVGIRHPAWILRLDVTQKGLAIQRCVVQLTEVFEAIVPL